MTDDKDLIYSPLQQSITRDGKSIEICIYRLPDSGWTLEAVDEVGNSTVWEDEFDTDQEALDFALKEIAEEGIDVFIGPDPDAQFL